MIVRINGNILRIEFKCQYLNAVISVINASDYVDENHNPLRFEQLVAQNRMFYQQRQTNYEGHSYDEVPTKMNVKRVNYPVYYCEERRIIIEHERINNN